MRKTVHVYRTGVYGVSRTMEEELLDEGPPSPPPSPPPPDETNVLHEIMKWMGAIGIAVFIIVIVVTQL